MATAGSYARDDGLRFTTEAYRLDEGLEAVPMQHGSVRRFDHDGKIIEIVTHYEITIDGEAFDDHLMVRDDGAVMYHGMPQYISASAVDMVKLIVDGMQQGEAPPLIGAPGGGHDHGGH